MKMLYLVRGLPGSGKTTLARRLAVLVFEADQFFEDDMGGYAFDREKLTEAHAQCQNNVRTAMLCEAETIAVSNTFTQHWEMDPYRSLARTHGYDVTEVTMTGPIFPNVHNVPADVIKRMAERWEY